MSTRLDGDELEKEIILLHQELILKRVGNKLCALTLLNECREKLNEEISLHTQTKSVVSSYLEQIQELKFQLEVSLEAAQKLEEENNKNRKVLIKLRFQTDAHASERQEFVDRCYRTGLENEGLRNEVTDLKEQLKGHVAFQQNYKVRQLENARLVDEILRKQDVLSKELTQLESACKEGLKFAGRVSEEVNSQAKFVREANASQRKMEDHMIRLMGALREHEERDKKRKLEQVSPREVFNYLDEWEIHQQETKTRIRQLMEENKRLAEELNLAEKQIELLTNNCLGEIDAI